MMESMRKGCVCVEGRDDSCAAVLLWSLWYVSSFDVVGSGFKDLSANKNARIVFLTFLLLMEIVCLFDS